METIEAVQQYVEEALIETPDIDNKVLYEEAKRIDARVGDMTLRAFYAKYPLQIKRAAANEAKRAAAAAEGRRAPRTGRALRGVLGRRATAPEPAEQAEIEVQGVEDVVATDEARELAARMDVDLLEVEGTGADGMVLEEDIMSFLEEAGIAVPRAAVAESRSAAVSPPASPRPQAPAADDGPGSADLVRAVVADSIAAGARVSVEMTGGRVIIETEGGAK